MQHTKQILSKSVHKQSKVQANGGLKSKAHIRAFQQACNIFMGFNGTARTSATSIRASSSGAIPIAVHNLSPDHLDAFTQAITRIIVMDLTTHVFTQIVYGKPVSQHTYDYAKCCPILNPVPATALPEAVEIAKCYQSHFQADSLMVDSMLAQSYQNTTIGSKEFKLRLLEITATTFHGMAVSIFNQVHDKGSDSCNPSSSTSNKDQLARPSSELPTRLLHADYMDYDWYPSGLADGVGYWAELCLFGGVVLFNRGDSECEALDAYLHPKFPYKIFKLSDSQVDSFVDFALSATDQAQNQPPSPLPIRTEKYAPRICPDESMALHIFRNKYERKPRHLRGLRPSYHRPLRLEDDPQMMDFIESYQKQRNSD
ncbi:predicted protein [Uncinocarpus reesii 1704]|uniref:Uncharacterized protein n=1 Tax=Uncinocarpus reesii (strain UAMH 1704) TaxID=336963 RepID=C4JED2_UNCRE|nr:uncharacterized protein UREG_00771 [Uncinocarpus reesii 1704]EEP75924.1 predicted protein [Uncinocarpus reesii 1704]